MFNQCKIKTTISSEYPRVTQSERDPPCRNGPMLFSGYSSAGASESRSCVLNMEKATEFAQVRTTGDVGVTINSQYGPYAISLPGPGEWEQQVHTAR